MLPSILTHLQRLVAFDTRNPPRAIGTDGIFDYLRAQLPGFAFDLRDHGAGAVSLLAVRGSPSRVFNVHIDTVPDAPGWSADPFALGVDDQRATGLGACDIKGAAACLLAAAQASTGAAALLFSSDEEANDPRCIRAFLGSDHGFAQAIVAEPTGCKVVLAHRGIASVQMRFVGNAGHASGVNALADNALHQAVRWGARALDCVANEAHREFDGLSGLRFNIGRIEGGIKANVIAPSADVRFGFRPLPSHDVDELHARFHDCAHAPPASYTEVFRGPALPAGTPAQASARHGQARALADDLGLPIGAAVDFWTEAALFSAAGLTTLVYGSGDIAQAHAADEWVALEQLRAAATTYRRLLEIEQ
ncbi:MAG: acetylornithine deacetylase [Proteobacteria bacterium]|nr:acetylornithine deacetylase [Pseudomonadota bacterium]